MATASQREVVVDGRTHEVLTTSMFQGARQAVEVVFFRGSSWFARLVGEGCTPEEIDEALARLTWSA